MKLGIKLSRKCRTCGQYEVYKCGYYPHRGMFGSLNCSQCNNRDEVCNSSKHTRAAYDC